MLKKLFAVLGWVVAQPERFCDWLKNHPLVQVVAALAVIIPLSANFMDLYDRRQERILRAWQVIAASPGAKGNIGQKDAVEFLGRKGADLRMVNLSYAMLYMADLRDTRLAIANLTGANLFRADLRGANLFEANLRDANLIDADLTGANLVGANLTGADLRSANLFGADLRSAVLYSADLTKVQDWNHKQFGGTRWDEDTKWPSDYEPSCPRNTKDERCTVRGRRIQ